MRTKSKISRQDKTIKGIYKSKKSFNTISFDKFKEWYLKLDKCCEYCGLTPEESLVLFKKYPHATRGGRRGKRLELDRKNPRLEYGSDLSNIVLACYWCNNAKTNYFTYDEFLLIGKSISAVHKKRLNKA
jgi:hypothetical protein